MNRYGRYRKCKVCKNVKSHNPEVSFHSFPQNPEKRNIWFALLGFDKYQEIPKWSYICSDHFNKNDFQYRKNGKKYLKSDSNPSLVQPEIFQPQLTGSRSNIGTEPSIVGDQSQKKRCALWFKLINKPRLPSHTLNFCHKNLRVCSQHFQPKDISLNKLRKRLHSDSVPVFGLCIRTPESVPLVLPVAENLTQTSDPSASTDVLDDGPSDEPYVENVSQSETQPSTSTSTNYSQLKGDNIIAHSLEHSHQPDLQKLSRQAVSNVCNRKAIDDIFQRPIKLIKMEVATSQYKENLTTQDLDFIRHNINRNRLSIMPLKTFLNQPPFSSLEEEDSKVDVPDVMSVDQLTPIDEATVKIEIKEEPLKVENDLLTSDIHEEPLLPFIKEEPSDEQGRITLETIEQLDESERESIQIFFDSMARTVMTLSPSFVRRIKLEVLRVVTDMEMEAHKENMEQSKEPRRKPNNATAISKEPEPNIKIEIEDDADTEALNVPDEPESSHPDHDTNLEPSRKKMKKSEAEQPTSSSSALMVDKTPRSQHETFFQSIAYTVTSFPPPFAFKTKMAVLKVVSKMQVEACRSRQNCCQDGEGKAYDSTKRPLLVSGSDY